MLKLNKKKDKHHVQDVTSPEFEALDIEIMDTSSHRPHLTSKPTTISLPQYFNNPVNSFNRFSVRNNIQKTVTTSYESEAANIVDFMKLGWKLPVPDLIISVTGGASAFKISSPKLHKVFQQGLVSAALTTSM